MLTCVPSPQVRRAMKSFLLGEPGITGLPAVNRRTVDINRPIDRAAISAGAQRQSMHRIGRTSIPRHWRATAIQIPAVLATDAWHCGGLSNRLPKRSGAHSRTT
jgi:hypothetical protein